MWAIAPFLRHTIAFLTADCKGNMYFCKEIAMAILVPKREKSKLVAFNYFEIVDCKQLKNFLNFHIIKKNVERDRGGALCKNQMRSTRRMFRF